MVEKDGSQWMKINGNWRHKCWDIPGGYASKALLNCSVTVRLCAADGPKCKSMNIRSAICIEMWLNSTVNLKMCSHETA